MGWSPDDPQTLGRGQLLHTCRTLNPSTLEAARPWGRESVQDLSLETGHTRPPCPG